MLLQIKNAETANFDALGADAGFVTATAFMFMLFNKNTVETILPYLEPMSALSHYMLLQIKKRRKQFSAYLEPKMGLEPATY